MNSLAFKKATDKGTLVGGASSPRSIPREKDAKRLSIYAMGLYFVVSPLEDFLSTAAGSAARYVMILVTFLVITDIFKKRIVIRLESPQICALYLVALSWMSVLWSIDIGVTASRNITYTLFPAMFLLLSSYSYSRSDLEFFEKVITLGGILAILIVVTTQGLGAFLLGKRIALTDNSDQNGTVGRLLCSLAFALKMSFDSTQRLSWRILAVASILGIGTMALFSGSRGGIVSIVGMMLVLALGMTSNRKVSTSVLIISILVIGYLMAPYILPKNIYIRIFNPSNYAMDYESSANRVVIWTNLLTKSFTANPILGVGSGCVGIENIKYWGKTLGSHNTYVCIIIEYGLLGLLAFICLLFNLIKRLANSMQLYMLSGLVGVLICVFFLDAYAKKYLWDALLMSAITLKVYEVSPKQLLMQ